jgi:hypothetical protein
VTDRVLVAATRWLGVPYGRPKIRADESVVDCSTLTARVLEAVLGELPRQAWADIVVADPTRPWSPIERAVRDGWGEVPPGDEPTWHGWYLTQAWVTIPTRGHAMLARYGPEGLRVLEATPGYGVRWRGAPRAAVAPLDLDDAPVLTVAQLAEAYPAGVRWARLRV